MTDDRQPPESDSPLAGGGEARDDLAEIVARSFRPGELSAAGDGSSDDAPHDAEDDKPFLLVSDRPAPLPRAAPPRRKLASGLDIPPPPRPPLKTDPQRHLGRAAPPRRAAADVPVEVKPTPRAPTPRRQGPPLRDKSAVVASEATDAAPSSRRRLERKADRATDRRDDAPAQHEPPSDAGAGIAEADLQGVPGAVAAARVSPPVPVVTEPRSTPIDAAPVDAAPPVRAPAAIAGSSRAPSALDMAAEVPELRPNRPWLRDAAMVGLGVVLTLGGQFVLRGSADEASPAREEFASASPSAAAGDGDGRAAGSPEPAQPVASETPPADDRAPDDAHSAAPAMLGAGATQRPPSASAPFEPHDDEHPPAPSPSATAAPSAKSADDELPPFNADAARAALASAAGAASGCGGEGSGVAQVTVTFANSGRATSANVSGSLAGTPAGSCVAQAMRSATVPPFSGPRVTVTKRVNVN